jgi:glyoxylase-like metal-dependent hydrolase (beta-lactamase superfamily II)
MQLYRITVGPLQENCYIAAPDGDEPQRPALVVDPGDEAERIIDALGEAGLKAEWIVCTHAHPDHTGAVAALQRATGARFAILDAEVPLLERFAGQTPSWQATPVEPCTPDRLLSDGDTVQVGDMQFQVIATPGHTPGGCCLFGSDVLFTGDTLFRGTIGRTDFPGGSMDEIERSIIDRLLTLPEQTLVLPGHGGESTLEFERQTNPFVRQWLARRDAGP